MYGELFSLLFHSIAFSKWKEFRGEKGVTEFQYCQSVGSVSCYIAVDICYIALVMIHVSK